MIPRVPDAPLPISIIVPTFREAPNLRPLVERIFAATAGAGLPAEVVVVDDDSRDGTEQVIAELARDHPVRLVVRHGVRGLAGAVLRGFAEARYDRFVVMDADLQHPPELIPALVARLDQGDADFVLGTRYAPGGEIQANWPQLRRWASRLATLLARPLVPLSDPMSGFFALGRATWERAAAVNPIGYKIGLELYVKARCTRPAEVPIPFATRAAGESKMTVSVNLAYLAHLVQLYHFRFPWLIWAMLFAMLAAAGLIWSAI
ncbi:MAG TPA: polyprenol monophosphomannose synthase [Phycisphaerae bacterium]|nr:polyprenol monophosphomannose synthase [Phycisphaerae bacterium]HNU46297.1 polyprenol monophosphomannose synthase [Phycisphaerae bacterium]